MVFRDEFPYLRAIKILDSLRIPPSWPCSLKTLFKSSELPLSAASLIGGRFFLSLNLWHSLNMHTEERKGSVIDIHFMLVEEAILLNGSRLIWSSALNLL